MLRYAIRRALWAVPTLFGVSLIVFFVTTLLPDPARAIDDDQTQIEARRARFLDLPRFFNAYPQDVHARADACLAHLEAGDAHAPEAARELARLGGAAFPYVLPRFDDLAPVVRGRVAIALAPIATRMDQAGGAKLDDPDQAALFWSRFWEDRAVDFTPPAVHRAVTRVIDHGTPLREHDLLALDTYALAELVPAFETTTDRDALARITGLAVHARGAGNVIAKDADDAHVARVRAEWRAWWFVHRTDFVALEGQERAAATMTETRYGKWVLGAATGELGVSARDGVPIAEKLKARAPVTLLLAALALITSFAIAIPLGVIAAWRRGHTVDVVLAIVLFTLYSMPAFLAAEILFHAFARQSSDLAWKLALAVIALALGSIATLSRYQRASLLDVLAQDYIRAARAKGLSALRVFVVHALRNALMPTLTLAGLQFPVLLGGAFVVEEVFAIPGAGYETLRAVEGRDTAWLVAIVLLTAVVTTSTLIASDVAYGFLDPRVRASLGRHRRGELSS